MGKLRDTFCNLKENLMKHAKDRRTPYSGDDIVSSCVRTRSDSSVTVDDSPVPTTEPKMFTPRCFELCKNQPLFRDAADIHLRQIASRCVSKSVKPSSVIIAQGDRITSRSNLYIIESGAAQVYVSGSQPFDFMVGEGDMFGELAMVFEMNRNATVISRGCKVWMLSHATLQTFLPVLPFVRTLMFLRNQILLRNLSDAELFEFVKWVHNRTCAPGTILTEQGQPGHDMYIVRRGKVGVFVNGNQVATLGRGDVLGQRALHGKPRTATCTFLENGVAVRVNEAVMEKLSDPVLRRILCCDAVVAVHQHSRIFGSFDQQQLENLLRTIEENIYHEGQKLMQVGEVMNDLYVVRDGLVKGLAVAEAGGFQYFGSITGHPCVSDVVVVSPNVSVVKCSRDGWLSILQTKSAMNNVKLEHLDILHEVGSGTCGKVRVAHPKSDPTKDYAVKTVPKSSKSFKQALSESAIMQSLSNPFCVRLFNIAEDDMNYHLIMEFVPGGELFEQLQVKGKFKEHHCRFYFGCVLLALEYLHRNGIVYRDLKPENLLVDARGYVKVTDFGFAKRIGNNRTFTICGTPEYQAPEIMSADLGATIVSDYWSLGVLLYEMLTGVSPFVPVMARPHERLQDPWVIIRNARSSRYVPPEGYKNTHVHDLITKLLQSDPLQRLQSITAIKSHPWLKDFDWQALAEQRMSAPPFQRSRKRPI